MNEEQRDNLIVELSHYAPSKIRIILYEYLQKRQLNDCSYPFYEFLKEKFEIEGFVKN